MEEKKRFNIDDAPMVHVTWLDARDTETGWMDIKKVLDAPLAKCQEVGWMIVYNSDKIVKTWIVKIEYLKVDNADIRN